MGICRSILQPVWFELAYCLFIRLKICFNILLFSWAFMPCQTFRNYYRTLSVFFMVNMECVSGRLHIIAYRIFIMIQFQPCELSLHKVNNQYPIVKTGEHISSILSNNRSDIRRKYHAFFASQE